MLLTIQQHFTNPAMTLICNSDDTAQPAPYCDQHSSQHEQGRLQQRLDLRGSKNATDALQRMQLVPAEGKAGVCTAGEASGLRQDTL